jgi:hypothetical protein
MEQFPKYQFKSHAFTCDALETAFFNLLLVTYFCFFTQFNKELYEITVNQIP